MRSLKRHIDEVDADYWEDKYYGTNIKRKIPIPTFQDSLILIFNKPEFIALKDLFQKNKKIIARMISFDEIEYDFNLN